MTDVVKMMEESRIQYRKMMEETIERALAQQKAMNDEMGVETTEEDRQELIDGYMAQMAQYEAMMEQQMVVQQAAMDSFQGQLADMFGDVDNDEEEDEDEELDEEAYNTFVEENMVPDKYMKYMPIGALLTGTHGEPYQTLTLIQDEEYTSNILENGWGIEDREDGLDMLESLLGGRHAELFAEDFANAKAGNYDEMDEDDVEDYEASIEAINEILELPKELILACDTLYAWDLDRIGYLVRLFVNMEYISEAEAWEWMKKAAVKVKETFSTWEEYIISLLMGRGFAMGLAQEPYAVALDLLTDSKEFLDSNPISNLA